MRKYGAKQRKLLFLIIAILCLLKFISPYIDFEIPELELPELELYTQKNENPPLRKMYTAYVQKVIDGDTIEVIFENPEVGRFNKTERIRLIGIDTPELFTDPPEPYAQEARNFTNKELYGKTVFIEFDENLRDRYDRLLSFVWYYDTNNRYTHFNELIIHKGYAKFYDYFSFNPVYMQRFKDAQRAK